MVQPLALNVVEHNYGVLSQHVVASQEFRALPARAAKVLAVLVAHAHRDTRTWQLTTQQLVERTGLSRSTVKRAKRDLRERCLVHEQPRFARVNGRRVQVANRFTLLDPPSHRSGSAATAGHDPASIEEVTDSSSPASEPAPQGEPRHEPQHDPAANEGATQRTPKRTSQRTPKRAEPNKTMGRARRSQPPPEEDEVLLELVTQLVETYVPPPCPEQRRLQEEHEGFLRLMEEWRAQGTWDSVADLYEPKGILSLEQLIETTKTEHEEKRNTLQNQSARGAETTNLSNWELAERQEKNFAYWLVQQVWEKRPLDHLKKRTIGKILRNAIRRRTA